MSDAPTLYASRTADQTALLQCEWCARPAQVVLLHVAWPGDAETALTELRLEALPRLATVGTWAIARPIRFLDLVDVDVPSIFDQVGKVQRPGACF